MINNNLLFRLLRRSHGISVTDFEEPHHAYGGNTVLRVSTDRGPLVVKVYERNVHPAKLLRSLQNMLVAESHGISVPHIMPAKNNALYSSVLDQLYVVGSYIGGEPPRTLLHRDVIFSLVKLHGISSSRQRFHFRYKDAASWRKVVPREFFHVLDQRSALISAACERELIACNQDNFDVGLIHGDLRRGNIILSNEGASFVDWDLSRVFYTGYEKFKILADCLLDTTGPPSLDAGGDYDISSFWRHFKIYISVQLSDFRIFKQSFRSYNNSAEFELNKLIRLEKLISLHDSLGCT